MAQKEITLAKYAGFCYGVKRAVDTVKKIKSDNPDKDVYVLGELIHNDKVIDELNSCGIKTLDSLPQKGKGICVVRTHGQSPNVFDEINNAGFEIVDLTCPDVKKVQQKAVRLAQNGYYLVIVGKEEHPEVCAIKANALQCTDKVVVSDSVNKLSKIENELKEYNKIGVVVQTTQTLSTLKPIIDYLETLTDNLLVMNTICPSTSKRQNEVEELAANNDLIIIVGSKNSANTTHLADIARKVTNTIHIESADELKKYSEIIDKSLKIGVSAGASTPQNIISDVVTELKGGNL